MKRPVTTTWLEMRSPDALRSPERIPEDLLLMRASMPSPELNRAFYAAIGGDYYWVDRLPWSWRQWHDWLSRPEVETWVAYQEGTPVAYFELERQPEDSVEISYFGVLPAFAGRGIGGYLLAQAAHRAWRMHPGIRRVWLHTCTLDHPGALRNYLARGFTIYREAEADMELPDHIPEPWPGAERSS